MSNTKENLQGKVITINKDKFNSIAKRLNKDMSAIVLESNKNSFFEVKSLKLSQTQDCLAKSLGFKNLHNINTFFESEKKLDNSDFLNYHTHDFLNNWESEKVILFFNMLLENNSNNNYKERALYLISTIINFLFYMKKIDGIIINASEIEKYLDLDVLVKTFRTRRDFPLESKNALKQYLSSLPGVKLENVKEYCSENTVDYHNQTKSQFNLIVDLIKKMEKDDALIINPNWYQVNMTKEKNHKDETHYTEIEIPFQEQSFDEISKLFNQEQWINCFNSCKDLHELYCFYKKSETEKLRLESIGLLKLIEYDDITENTWLKDPMFQDIIFNLIKNKNFKIYYLSDLILYTINILNQKKQEVFIKFIHNILKNYSSTLKYSEYLNKLISEKLPNKT